MINPVKGMEIKHLPEGRFLLRFNHIIDRNRAMAGCPWSFEKNILILNSIGVDENPMQVDLDWCDFFVHIHDLPLSKMNLGVATSIGNRIGKFRDMEMDDRGCAWGASLRIRVGVNVNDPLKRALKITTPLGGEHLISFTYERLPNFCYVCGRLGHIGKYYKVAFAEGFVDPKEDTPYRPWLRAPLSRLGQGKTELSEGRDSVIPRQQTSGERRGKDIFGGFEKTRRTSGDTGVKGLGTAGISSLRDIDSNSMGRPNPSRAQGENWGRNGCMEVSSESIIPEIRRECSQVMEGEQKGGAGKATTPSQNQGNEEQETRLGEEEVEQTPADVKKTIMNNMNLKALCSPSP
ncbi:UNVERIFIED_CONTAM: hypothetical protein Sradi_0741300 [Sesamum radiatum]|uniref:Zinc knuckle CX2CX4HX4C domain-containing protein n=1 Tax=Sesamum radiatum TaxID=300843 RepID=A0AAW2VP90_SESRA